MGFSSTMRCLFLLSLLCVAGCASGSARSRLPAGFDLRWPAPPGEARIAWTGEITEPADLGIDKGIWTRLVELVSGEEENKIVRPYGVHADGEGRVYVTDPGAGVVHLYDTGKGQYSRLRGMPETPLLVPIGVSGDGAGTVYVTDSESGSVFRHVVGDDHLKPFITGLLKRPTGIAFNRVNGLLYLAETEKHQIVVFDRDGGERFRIGSRGEEPGDFNYPTDLWIDRQGRLLVTDALNFRIQIFTATGGFITSVGFAGDAAGSLSKPKGVAVDSDGHLYVVDALLDAVQIFDENGQLLLVFGVRGSRPGEFWMPAGIFIGADDAIYVADAYNYRIQTFRYRRAAGAVSVPPRTEPVAQP